MRRRLSGTNDNVVFLSLAEVSFVFSFSIVAFLLMSMNKDIDKQRVVGNRACFGFHNEGDVKIRPYPVATISFKETAGRYVVLFEDLLRNFGRISGKTIDDLGEFGFQDMNKRRDSLSAFLSSRFPAYGTQEAAGNQGFPAGPILQVEYGYNPRTGDKLDALPNYLEAHKLLLSYIGAIGEWSREHQEGGIHCEAFLHVSHPASLPEKSLVNLRFLVPYDIRQSLLPISTSNKVAKLRSST